MESSESLKSLYTGQIEQDNGTYQVTLPKRELAAGPLVEGEPHRIALISKRE